MANSVTEMELKAIVDASIDAAMGEMGGDLAEDRANAMDRYLGEPYGDEVEGRSSVMARDVIDVIEWIMPSLVEIFTATDTAVEIEPQGPEDEVQAQQETDYLNHIFYKKNQGFLILYSWFKDALLQKNGICKAYAEQVEKVSRETYENLTDIEYQALLADDELELEEHTRKRQFIDGIEVIVHDAVFSRTSEDTEINVEVVPPEEFLISNDARSVNPKQAYFTAQHTTKTVTELREMGFSDGDIEDMENGPGMVELTEERQSRLHLSDETRWDDVVEANEAMQSKKITECYVRVDMNGDGKAELIKVFRSGDFIDWEEMDENPFSAITPVILTHKFFGLSVADLLSDLQKMRTGLLRAFFDNFYQTINGKTYYDENTVNVEDLLTSRPYGIRAVDGPPSQSVMEIPPNGLPPQAYTLMEMVDKLRQDRIGDFSNQLDPNVLANANNGVVMEMINQAQAKVKMIARVFAETGVKQLFRDLHRLARTHGDKETVVKLRDQWVPITPSSWRERTDFTVRVGLGYRNKQEQAASLAAIMDVQKQYFELDGGSQQLVTLDNLYHSAKEFTKIMGEINPNNFFPAPDMRPPPPPPDNTQKDVIMLTAQIEQQKNQTEQMKAAMQNQIKQQELELKHANFQAEQSKEAAKQVNEELRFQLDQLKAESDRALAEAKTLLEAEKQANNQSLEMMRLELDEFKAELQSATTLTKEVMGDNGGQILEDLVNRISTLEERL